MSNPRRGLITAGVFLGIGLGGFFDGIVLHQILQWHHLVSETHPVNTLDNFELNTLLDGIFHAFTYICTAIGVYLLWRVQRQNGRLSGWVLIGAMLMGWGGFNLVEGIVDHHLLQIHHVRPGDNELLWDIGFLIWGALMLIGGWWLVRSNQPLSKSLPASRERL